MNLRKNNQFYPLYNLLIFVWLFAACHSVDCSGFPSSFNSYKQALSEVQDAHFSFTDKLNTSKSSWVRGASYYSCDGETGYLIIQTDTSGYIHAGVPLSEWRSFKVAPSFGKFYNRHFKGKYRLILP